MDYLDNHNADPKPFIWTKFADEILKKGRQSKTTVRVKTLAAA
jgi:hypothetical protein